MTLLEVYDWLRHANVALAAAVTALLLCRLGAFARAPWPSKVGRLVVFGWVTSTGFGTWEALAQAATLGARIPAITTMLVLSGYYVWVEWRCDRTAARQALALLRRDSTAGP